MTSSASDRIVRALRPLVPVLLSTVLFVPAALATDYFVRTDGSDANTGTSNTAGGAWKTVKKCAGAAKAGDRCLVQPGTYREKSITQTTAGQLVAAKKDFNGDGLPDNCTCTKGGTSLTCSVAVTGVNPGDFVRCEAGHGFNWSKVATVSGSTINLAEPYRGLAGTAPLDIAKFVEILGQGTRPEDTLITTFSDKPSGVTWTKESGTTCVYSYPKSSATGAWAAPQGFRENVSDAEWDLYGHTTNGRDTFIKAGAAKCPCGYGTTTAQVDAVAGSWADDGTKVYIQTRSCQDPGTRPIQASDTADYAVVLQSQQPYSVVDNFTVEAGGADDGYVNVAFVYVVNFGASNARYSRIRAQNGRAHILLSDGLKDTSFEHFRALSGSLWGSGMNLSGVRFYDTEWRGGYTNLVSIDQLSGAAADDPVIFDRFYMHRSFTQYRAAQCNAGGDYYNCSTKTWKAENFGVHGYFLGNETVARAIDHLLFQNGVIELTYDGLAVFNGLGARDITIRNCTFGYNGSLYGSGWRQEVLQMGNSADANYGFKAYNNIFYCDDVSKDCDQRIHVRAGNYGGITSDYNLYLLPYNTLNGGAQPIWGGGTDKRTLDQAIIQYGQEQHSMMVCNTGCSATNGRVFNDGANARQYFKVPTPTGGKATDYTPTTYSRAVNAGLNSQCPTEDFYGNPRNDGSCDVGAVEMQGGGGSNSPPATPSGMRRIEVR